MVLKLPAQRYEEKNLIRNDKKAGFLVTFLPPFVWTISHCNPKEKSVVVSLVRPFTSRFTCNRVWSRFVAALTLQVAKYVRFVSCYLHTEDMGISSGKAISHCLLA